MCVKGLTRGVRTLLIQVCGVLGISVVGLCRGVCLCADSLVVACSVPCYLGDACL